MFDDYYSFETLHKLGGISEDLFKYALNKFAELYNLKAPNLSVDQELVDFIEKEIELIHPEKFRITNAKVSDAESGKCIVNFNNKNGYLEIDEQFKIKTPLQPRGIR
jgi:hypothetical protein